MIFNKRMSLRVCLVVVFAMLMSSSVYAQLAKREERAARDQQKTKQAQAVSKEVYAQIEKAQELLDEDNDAGALRLLNRLYNPDKLTEYEQVNVLNYLGFIYYNMDDITNAMRTL